MSRLKDKIEDIEKYLDELEDIIPHTFQKYKSSNLIRAACERYVEKITEAVTDIAFIVIKKEKLAIPEDDIDSFKILMEKNIITNELYSKLKLAKGMRNIIAHEYAKIDDEIIFNSISNELDKDIRKFIALVNNFYSMRDKI